MSMTLTQPPMVAPVLHIYQDTHTVLHNTAASPNEEKKNFYKYYEDFKTFRKFWQFSIFIVQFCKCLVDTFFRN